MEIISQEISANPNGLDIISAAGKVGLDPGVLYKAVINLSAKGLFTATCINLAAGVLLEDLGLPIYFFEHITCGSLENILQAIATSIEVIDGRAILKGSVTQIDFNTTDSKRVQQVRIATEETRDNMEAILAEMLPGRRRDYYFSDRKRYYTYIIRPEIVSDFPQEAFQKSRFLFSLDDDYSAMPEPTRRRYEKFLEECEKSTTPLIHVYNLSETGETRFMFNSDFVSPQLQVLRKIMADHDLVIGRAYWEAYTAKKSVSSSVCTLYVKGELSRRQEESVVNDLRNFLAYPVNPIQELYVKGLINFQEMLFAGNCIDFCRLFIYKENYTATDREILENLTSKDQRESFAKRIQGSNKSTYGTSVIRAALSNNPDLIKYLYSCFEQKFSPAVKNRIIKDELQHKRQEFDRIIASRFIDFQVGREVLLFMFKIISSTLKTNFYKPHKRSFSFRFDNTILDPLVFSDFVYGIFYVNGHYSSGTHLRAADIARGGLRLIRVSSANYEDAIDNAVLLNYALGPQAQRLKHKDICESGSKGVIVPHPPYAVQKNDALRDYTEGIMDLIMPDEYIVDYYGRQEMVFFGPDEGTAQLMDDIAIRARERGYTYWRTLTTGKSTGIPHDTYGLLSDGSVFGLFDRGKDGVDLQVEGKSRLVTNDMDALYDIVGEKIEISGMTTTSIMSSFRTLINHYGQKEEELNLMMTGGPDGDLGANQIQCYKGNICLVIDGGSVLFDPAGLDKRELRKLAFQRNSSPRINSLGYPKEKLSKIGFMVPVGSKAVRLPDGRIIEDGTLFHRTFLTNPENRELVSQANIRAFIPCGGFKDTINHDNVKDFVELFNELEFIVEGANVYFDASSRRYMAVNTKIKQIKDTTANKGGVFSSSIAEVLTGFLLGEKYEDILLEDTTTQWSLIRDVIQLVKRYAFLETDLLIRLYEIDSAIPLFELSESSSENIFQFQEYLENQIEVVRNDSGLIDRLMEKYIPETLYRKIGRETINDTLEKENLQPYRNAIITKKLSSLAYYQFGCNWDSYVDKSKKDLMSALHQIFQV